MIRFIFFIIVTYIIFKIIGMVLLFVRRIMNGFHSGQHSPARTAEGRPAGPRTPNQYSNVEDVDYEDITDKK